MLLGRQFVTVVGVESRMAVFTGLWGNLVKIEGMLPLLFLFVILYFLHSPTSYIPTLHIWCGNTEWFQTIVIMAY